MQKVNVGDIEEQYFGSPKGTFEVHRRHVRPGLDGEHSVGEWGGGHPFDAELCRMRPGMRNYPLHAHAAAWEYYIVLAGAGVYRTEGGEERIREGDHIMSPPGEAHQIMNDGDVDLEFSVIATNPQADVTTYPESDKRMISPEGLCFEPTAAFYFKGEE